MESKTKKKLATAVAGVAVVGAAVSLTAGTFSYFTDSDTTGSQNVATGHLSVGTSLDRPINASKIVPGWSQKHRFTVTNTGNVPGNLSLKVLDQGSDPALRDAVMLCGIDGNGCVSLGDVENAGAIPGGKLQPGRSYTYRFEITLPDSGNQNALEDLQVSAQLQATLTSIDK